MAPFGHTHFGRAARGQGRGKQPDIRESPGGGCRAGKVHERCLAATLHRLAIGFTSDLPACRRALWSSTQTSVWRSNFRSRHVVVERWGSRQPKLEVASSRIVASSFCLAAAFGGCVERLGAQMSRY